MHKEQEFMEDCQLHTIFDNSV